MRSLGGRVCARRQASALRKSRRRAGARAVPCARPRRSPRTPRAGKTRVTRNAAWWVVTRRIRCESSRRFECCTCRTRLARDGEIEPFVSLFFCRGVVFARARYPYPCALGCSPAFGLEGFSLFFPRSPHASFPTRRFTARNEFSTRALSNPLTVYTPPTHAHRPRSHSVIGRFVSLDTTRMGDRS